MGNYANAGKYARRLASLPIRLIADVPNSHYLPSIFLLLLPV